MEAESYAGAGVSLTQMEAKISYPVVVEERMRKDMVCFGMIPGHNGIFCAKKIKNCTFLSPYLSN